MGERDFTVEVEREQIAVTSMGLSVPDKDWLFVDAAGHEHRWGADEVPTLRWVVTGVWWCWECSDTHEEGEYRCVECDQAVKPGWVPAAPVVTYLPGLKSGRLVSGGKTWILRPAEMEALEQVGEAGMDAWAEGLRGSRPPDEWVEIRG